MSARLGIVAGRGGLPLRLARACVAAGRPVFVLVLEGQADAGTFRDFPSASVPLGRGGEAISILRSEGVEELVFAGGVGRPSLSSLYPDARTARFLAKVGMRALGDDRIMTLIVRELEQEGFRVVGADEVLTDLLPETGRLGSEEPDAIAREDIRRGISVTLALGRADCGQAAVVQQGVVLAIEAVEGTDAMIERAGGLRRDGPGGVLVKLAKPQQERRIDLPTIGVETVRRAAAAGLRGIAVEAGGSLIVDRTAVIAEADRLGLFLVGIRPGAEGA